jgi:hypothetical protein
MKVRDDVAHVLARQRMVRPNLLVVRLTKVWSTRNDDGPKALITDESEVAGVGDVLLALLMAAGTARLKDLAAQRSGADSDRRIWRHAMRVLIRVSPSRTHSADKYVHLLRGEKSACRFAERWHLGSGHAGGNPMSQ